MREAGDIANIDVVSVAAAVAVEGELRVVDGDRAVRIGGTEQALLIVVEIDVGEREIAALIADRRAVIVGRRQRH